MTPQASALDLENNPGLEDATPALALTPEVASSAQAWESAWQNTPRLVSLQEDQTSTDPVELLESRLKLLGSKTFSNREWRSYWERQNETGSTLLTALKAVPANQSAPQEILDGLAAWTALAADKIENQDRYFNAIETETDAVEDRLESVMESQANEESAPTPRVENPNPFMKRKLHLEDLERQIENQQAKRQQTESEISFIERQLASEAVLVDALERDAALAQRELDIARRQIGAQGGAEWTRIWNEVSDKSAIKVDKISKEAEHGAAHLRSREVELGLTQSRLQFRDSRVAALGDELEQAGSIRGWWQASVATVTEWFRSEAWKIGLGLIGIWLALRISLQVLSKFVSVLIARAEGDPDDNTDDDQRIKTLATVFWGVARIAIYVVAGLLAMEVIGINTGPILGSVAILGLAVSFGSQNLVRDVVNGFFILLENQYAVGEVVNIGGMSGTVEQITIRSTWVRAWTGDLHVIPNGTISKVSNSTRDWAVAPCHIGVGYGSDLAKVKEVVNQVGEEMMQDEDWMEVLETAPAWVGVTELGDSAITIRCAAKCRPGSQWGLSRELNQRLKEAFDEAKIDIPFPQRVVHQA